MIPMMKKAQCPQKLCPDPRRELRFIQFRRKNNPASMRLGLISEDGEKFVELADDSCNTKCMRTVLGTDCKLTCEKAKCLPVEKVAGNIQLLAPVTNPEKIICIYQNYTDSCQKSPKEPVFYSKFPSAITGPYGRIKAHEITKQLDWGIELAVVMGKEASSVSPSDAMDYVFGYTIAQDITAADWINKDSNGGQFLISKSMDTFLPLGPAIVHKSMIQDPYNLEMTCSVNKKVKQKGNTKDIIFKIDDIISQLSRCITLQPGDVILTGTPSGIGMSSDPPEYLKPCDIIESEIQSIGKLLNKVVAVP